MTTVPPPTTPPVPTAVPAPAAPVVLILAPPAAVAALPAGAQLNGVVLPPPPQPPGTADATDARTAVTVRTPAGDITLRLPAPLPPGTDVALQVVRASPDQATVRLITVNDQPAAQVLAQLRQTAAAVAPPLDPVPQTLPAPATALPPANAWTPQGPVALPALGTLSAYVVQGTPLLPNGQLLSAPETGQIPAGQIPPGQTGVGQTAAAQVPAFVLATGGELAVRVTSLQLPSGEPPILTPPLPGTTPSPATPIIVPAPATPANPTAVPLQPAPTPLTPPAPPQTPAVAAPVIAAATPPTPQPAVIVAGPQGLPPAPPTPPLIVQSEPPQAVLTGIVVRGAPDSPPVITTDLGAIQLNVRANLPVGTRVTLEVAMQFPPEQGAAAPPLPMTTLPLSGPPLGATVGWPNLGEALVQLQRADPVAAAQFAEAIPDGGPRTLVAVMAFAQAMRSGDSRSWPGDSNLRALENLGPRGAHLARQIGDEVKALAARAPDTGGSEWRALPVPWNADGRIDRITLITRREGDAEDAGGGKKSRGGGTRFLVSLDLSRLGPLQLDGMFRKEARGLEIMIRTKQPLPDTLRLELLGLFGASTAAMGLTGALSFQVVRKFPDPVGAQPHDKSGVWA